MFARTTIVKTALLLAFGGALLAAPAPVVAAPRIQEAAKGDVEPTTASLIADIHLPDGANRATAAGDMAQFNDALQTVARNNQGKISTSEVLIWTGDAAKTIVTDIAHLLKNSGYTVADTTAFDSEAGRVTPVAAMRGSKSDSLIGLWIEAKDGTALLIWGRFSPDAPSAPKTAAATPKKATAAPKKIVAARPRKSSSSSRSSSTESAAVRQARAMKAYQDYQYVKMMGPISGPMYSSRKW